VKPEFTSLSGLDEIAVPIAHRVDDDHLTDGRWSQWMRTTEIPQTGHVLRAGHLKEISSNSNHREPAATMAASSHARETIDKNNTIGSAQSRTSTCVKDQPRRALPAGPMDTFMSELSFFCVRLW
jgi:hypothetical protein